MGKEKTYPGYRVMKKGQRSEVRVAFAAVEVIGKARKVLNDYLRLVRWKT